MRNDACAVCALSHPRHTREGTDRFLEIGRVADHPNGLLDAEVLAAESRFDVVHHLDRPHRRSDVGDLRLDVPHVRCDAPEDDQRARREGCRDVVWCRRERLAMVHRAPDDHRGDVRRHASSFSGAVHAQDVVDAFIKVSFHLERDHLEG